MESFTKRLFRGTHNENRMMVSHERTLHPQRTATHSDKSKWVQDSCAPLQGTSHETATPRLPLPPGTPPGPNTHSPQGFRGASDTDGHHAGDCIDSSPRSPPNRTVSVDAVTRCSPFDDCSPYIRPTPSTTPSSTGSVAAESVESLHAPSFKRSPQSRELELHQSLAVQDGQGAITPLSPSKSRSRSRASDFPITRHDPNNSAHILKLLKRDGAGATCLWPHDGGECGFTSQIDLVKRHIKRVHYRLRWGDSCVHKVRMANRVFQAFRLPVLRTALL